jgi:hypothetical protein
MLPLAMMPKIPIVAEVPFGFIVTVQVKCGGPRLAVRSRALSNKKDLESPCP